MLTHLLSVTLRWEGGTEMWVIFVERVLHVIHVLFFFFYVHVHLYALSVYRRDRIK